MACTSDIRPNQRGFSLVELMIAVLIALFLLGGLVTLVIGTRKTSTTQTALSQLQDNERIAMTMITNIVQKAGYFPDPVNQTLSNFVSETIGPDSLASAQPLGGGSSAPGDTLVSRFFAPNPDPNLSVIDCAGQSNTANVANLWYTNMFTVGVVNNVSWLQCVTQSQGAGTPQTINLIPNVTKITVLYGVGSASAGDDYSVVRYLTATQVNTAAIWPSVTVVKVTLTFQIPAAVGQQGAGATTAGQMTDCVAYPNSCTTTFTRVIPVMSRAGVNT